jgi:hypothetical protein
MILPLLALSLPANSMPAGLVKWQYSVAYDGSPAKSGQAQRPGRRKICLGTNGSPAGNSAVGLVILG